MLEPVTRRFAATISEWDGTHGIAVTEQGERHPLEYKDYQATPFTLALKPGMRVELFVSYDERGEKSGVEFRKMPTGQPEWDNLWGEHYAGEYLSTDRPTHRQQIRLIVKEISKFLIACAVGIGAAVAIGGQSWAKTWENFNFYIVLLYSGIFIFLRLIALIQFNKQKHLCKIMDEGILFSGLINSRNTDVLLLWQGWTDVTEPRRWSWLLGESIRLTVYQNRLMLVYTRGLHEAESINQVGKTTTLRIDTRYLKAEDKQRLLHILQTGITV